MEAVPEVVLVTVAAHSYSYGCCPYVGGDGASIEAIVEVVLVAVATSHSRPLKSRSP